MSGNSARVGYIPSENILFNAARARTRWRPLGTPFLRDFLGFAIDGAVFAGSGTGSGF
jgi:hypothetical protein